jgi:hypothetical protein
MVLYFHNAIIIKLLFTKKIIKNRIYKQKKKINQKIKYILNILKEIAPDILENKKIQKNIF